MSDAKQRSEEDVLFFSLTRNHSHFHSYQVHDGHDFLRVLHQLVVQLARRRVAPHVLAVDGQVELARGAHANECARVQAEALVGVVDVARNVRVGVLL